MCKSPTVCKLDTSVHVHDFRVLKYLSIVNTHPCQMVSISHPFGPCPRHQGNVQALRFEDQTSRMGHGAQNKDCISPKKIDYNVIASLCSRFITCIVNIESTMVT